MNDLLLFLKENWVTLTTTFGVATAWFVDRKKRAEELKITQSSSLEGMQNAYDKFVEDAQKQYDALNGKIEKFEERERKAIEERSALQESVKNLKETTESDKKTIEDLKKRITEYEVKIETYEKRVSELTAELSQYKK